MKVLLVLATTLTTLSAAAQTSSKPQAGQKSLENLQVPPGWILVMPANPDGTSGPPQKAFQLPKDWAAQRPAGAPVGKDWPYMVPLGAPTGVAAPRFAIDFEASQDLIKKQTDAITFLSQRIDKLDARIKELEAQVRNKK